MEKIIWKCVCLFLTQITTPLSVYFECKFDLLHVVAFILSAAFGVWYILKKVRIQHFLYLKTD